MRAEIALQEMINLIYFDQLDFQEVLDIAKSSMLKKALITCGNNQTKAAKLCGLNRGTCIKYIRNYNLLVRD